MDKMTAEEARLGYPFRVRVETLRSLLRRNGRALQLLADLQTDLNHLSESDFRIRRPLHRLLDEVLLMCQELNLLSRDKYLSLYPALDRIRARIKSSVSGAKDTGKQALVTRLSDEPSLDASLVGGKAAGVGSVRRLFPEAVPDGFIITTEAYRLFVRQNDLGDRLRLLLGDLEVSTDRDRFRMRTEVLRGLVRSSEIPAAIRESIADQAARTAGVGPTGWAVRSSAISEDSRFSFAGQFDTLLRVKTADLAEAYREVLASRFTDRAVLYRLGCGCREVDTPMAVLFMPMVEPVAAGVIYTSDPRIPDAGRMVVNAVPGLGDEVVKGRAQADTFHLSREPVPRLVETIASPDRQSRDSSLTYLPENALSELGAMAYRAAQAWGCELDIEWALDHESRLWLLQGRRLNLASPERIRGERSRKAPPRLEGGVTISPGRAEGPVVFRKAPDWRPVPRGSVLVVDVPDPRLSPLLPDLAALLAEEGSPAGHLATLLREASIPSVFRLGSKADVLRRAGTVSVDATNRRVYEGSRWPGMKERVHSRLASTQRSSPAGPLQECVLCLNLTDPFAQDFRADNCRSLHDIIRFTHEMAVRSMFEFGDRNNRLWNRKVVKLKTGLPIKMRLLDLEKPLPGQRHGVSPESIESIPFRAFWKGFADPSLAWPQRWESRFLNVPSDFREQVLGGGLGPRRRTDTNYVFVTSDYFNLNARFTYHYTMVDSLVGPGTENNYVHFRFHSGGASDENRQRRAKFLETVLRDCRFSVDRRGDLLIAWLKGYPQADSEHALETLGRLMVCARELDLLMRSDSDMKAFTERFLKGDYRVFSGV